MWGGEERILLGGRKDSRNNVCKKKRGRGGGCWGSFSHFIKFDSLIIVSFCYILFGVFFFYSNNRGDHAKNCFNE